MAIVKLLENQHIELYWKCGWHIIMDSFILTLIYYERIVNIVCTIRILIDKQAPWNPDAPALYVC